jgi:hypothetical protein
MMKRGITHARAPAPARTLKLQCLECTHMIRVARDELVEGGTVYCRHCDTESELTLGLDGSTGREAWMLLDPLVDLDDDDEEERRV